jgi:hypothetical protein
MEEAPLAAAANTGAFSGIYCHNYLGSLGSFGRSLADLRGLSTRRDVAGTCSRANHIASRIGTASGYGEHIERIELQRSTARELMLGVSRRNFRATRRLKPRVLRLVDDPHVGTPKPAPRALYERAARTIPLRFALLDRRKNLFQRCAPGNT